MTKDFLNSEKAKSGDFASFPCFFFSLSDYFLLHMNGHTDEAAKSKSGERFIFIYRFKINIARITQTLEEKRYWAGQNN